MAHPQNSPRGLFSKKAINISGASFTNDFTFNSTGALITAGLYISNSTAKILTSNSTGFISSGRLTATDGVVASNQTTFGLVTANSTAMILPNSVRVGAKTTYFSSNSTGVKLGTRYISTNTTGNTNT